NRGAGEEHRAFDDRVRDQLTGDLPQRHAAVLELHHRGPRHDPKGVILRQLGDERLGHAVHEVLGLVLVRAEILQRQTRPSRAGRGRRSGGGRVPFARDQFLQGNGHVAGRRKAVLGPLGEAPGYQLFQFEGKSRARCTQGGRLIAKDGGQDLGRTVAWEGTATGRLFVEYAATREEGAAADRADAARRAL